MRYSQKKNPKIIILEVSSLLLELFLKNPDRVYTRENLLDILWGIGYPSEERTIDVHMRRLREKLEDNPAEPKYLRTKWGVGYYYKED